MSIDGVNAGEVDGREKRGKNASRKVFWAIVYGIWNVMCSTFWRACERKQVEETERVGERTEGASEMKQKDRDDWTHHA